MDPTDIFVLIWELSQPGASLDIIMCSWADPNVMDKLTAADGNRIHPSQYVLSPFFSPKLDILLIDAG
jgi:hypothetical protein